MSFVHFIEASYRKNALTVRGNVYKNDYGSFVMNNPTNKKCQQCPHSNFTVQYHCFILLSQHQNQDLTNSLLT